MMIMTNLFQIEYLILTLALLVATILIMSLFLKNKNHDFKETFAKYRKEYISIFVDEENDLVEMYYQFNQDTKLVTMTIEEFKLKFDKDNLDKLILLKNDLFNDKAIYSSFYYYLSMYDINYNIKDYKVRIDAFDKENRKYFLTFKDITDEKILNIDNKVLNNETLASFINTINENKDDVYDTLIASISFADYEGMTFTLNNYLNIVNTTIYKEIRNEFKDDYIYLSNNFGILFVRINNGNEESFTKDIRYIVNKYSKSYQFNKMLVKTSLCAGIKNIEDNILELNDFKDTKNTILKKQKYLLFSDRVFQFNDDLALEKSSHINLAEKIKKIVVKNEYSFYLDPIVDINSKDIICYEVKLNTNNNIDSNTFLQMVREIGLRKKIYTNLFNFLLKNDLSYTYIISVDNQDFNRLIDVYNLYANKNLNIIFAIYPLKNSRRVNFNMYTLLSTLKENKEKHKNYRFAINIDSIYECVFPKELYDYFDYLMLSDSLISKSLESFKNLNVLKYYIATAKSNNVKLIATDVNNYSLVEKMKLLDINNMAGLVFKNVIKDNKIIDKSFVRRLDNIKGLLRN